jgi:hypothetical protein
MIKRFTCIVLLLTNLPYLSSGQTKTTAIILYSAKLETSFHDKKMETDTILRNGRKQEREERNKIKELAKARKQPKPEKIESGDDAGAVKPKQKPKRQRRPEGLERPPEIPRRNGN